MRRKKGLLVHEIDGEVVVLDPELDQVHQFNATASLIWRLYDSGIEPKQISKRLAIDFGVGEDQAVRDVSDALQEFERLQLLGGSSDDIREELIND